MSESSAPRGQGVVWLDDPPFRRNAAAAVDDTQLRHNIRHATTTIRERRNQRVAELPDWPRLRAAAAAIKDDVLAHLDRYLEQFEERASAHGAQVHWARDATEANQIVVDLVAATGHTQVVKVKSMATDEIGLVDALASAGVDAWETDLAELIVQLGQDRPSHILVPAIHRNRAEIREIFLSRMDDAPADLSDDPQQLAEAARRHLRRRFLETKVAISGANFAIAETGSLLVAESEGNGRMCLTLPETLISVVGIEKLLPSWRDLEVFLQVLPRSSTGERCNPYNSVWTGVHPGDGPAQVHIVLLDNGRTATLADELGRQALRCIRCSACLNICPVYARTGGHAYGSVYPGPIGAVLTPLLVGVEHASALPYASSLCGACYEVCPVAIDIPSLLVELRHEVVAAQRRSRGHPSAQDALFAAAGWAMSGHRRWGAALSAGQAARPLGRSRDTIGALPPPLAGWTGSRDFPRPPAQTFRQWWVQEHKETRE
ncbi:MAG: L-lactate dehydrogenase complex protein LldF [Pseudonocardiales bacterium]|jgi:L-lactate dehydrogenase complex protein LldF|nr:L-lactate dehydrogenase complex protein LldF [Pseudonocardiales bacterium]